MADQFLDLDTAATKDDVLRGLVTGQIRAGFRGPLDAEEATLRAVGLDEAVIVNGEFLSVEMHDGTAVGTRFEQSRLRNVRFVGADLSGLAFTARCKLEHVTFERCKLSYSNWFEVTLDKVTFVECAMRESRFHGTTMRAVDVVDCDLTSSSFEDLAIEPGALDLRGSSIDDTSGLARARNLKVDTRQAAMLSAALLDAQGIEVADDREP